MEVCLLPSRKREFSATVAMSQKGHERAPVVEPDVKSVIWVVDSLRFLHSEDWSYWADKDFAAASSWWAASTLGDLVRCTLPQV